MSWKQLGSLALVVYVAACGEAPDMAGPVEADALDAPEQQAPEESSEEAIRGPVLRVPGEYPTIQAAVDAASPGDTVHVAPGVYNEHVRLKSGIRLLGSGAPFTVLDAQGASRALVDFSYASDVVIEGFTFRNVGSDTPCGLPASLSSWCSGNWYTAAVYAMGGKEKVFARIAFNIFEHNDTAMLLYFRARADVRHNLFQHNQHGLLFNHFNDTATVEGNVFWKNAFFALGVQAGAIDIRYNLIAGSNAGIVHMYIQTGDIRCNVFAGNGGPVAETFYVPNRIVMGENGNIDVELPGRSGDDAPDLRSVFSRGIPGCFSLPADRPTRLAAP
ncbi:right-handed parallel beta-helix repeat-containing protein [Myxococcus qinghaiensis]|uniref:right-handed parallel beta-helix repeat-containing protein n=1 Tax=Myxococcus qinghaiensis TaxID=2906758 RepID=UPI0020A6EB4C|nr:right-handed parallel beta-helix repeat-containing protein [Myxococcus qinghaiensis]MCP3162185.1 right-handed parallel beta-helix repeat-containing protein [Myxococcus qinghaiensis]